MNQHRPGLAMIGALLLAAFFLGPLSAPAALAQDAQPSAPPPGKALLYIFRSDRQPSEALVPVSVNADIAGYLENDTFIAVSVDPGRTFLRSGDRVLATLALETAADRTYYVRVRAVHGVTLVQTEIDLVDEPQGRNALAQSRFMPAAAPAAPPQATAGRTPRPEQAVAPAAAERGAETGSADKPDSSSGQGYVRLDIGYSKSTNTNITEIDFTPGAGFICGNATCTTAGVLKDVGGGPLVSLGFGTHFSPHTRGEVTAALRNYKLNASDSGVPPTKFTSNVTAVTFMANFYYDFAASGVNPYVGLGAGWSMNRFGPLTFDDGAGFSGTADATWKNSIAGSAMLGVAFPLSGSMLLDLGARYTYLGEINLQDAISGTLKAYELTLGLRF